MKQKSEINREPLSFLSDDGHNSFNFDCYVCNMTKRRAF